MRKLIFTTILLASLCSCSHTKDDSEKPDLKPANLYTQGQKALEEKDYKKSAELFSKITYEFPYYSGVSKAHIMEIYSYYMQGDYDEVIFSAENYIKTYPMSKQIAYVYYMKALAYYEQIGLPYRDYSMATDAKGAFQEVASRFNGSSYAKDAGIKIKMINNHLASHEMIIGRYYLNKGEILSAIGRFKDVISSYTDSSQVEEALYRLAEAYTFLGMRNEGKKHTLLLAKKYPNSTWNAPAAKLAS